MFGASRMNEDVESRRRLHGLIDHEFQRQPRARRHEKRGAVGDLSSRPAQCYLAT
jgi:hypothetical protein